MNSRLLEQVAKRTGLSESGKNWLISASDPFHDKDLTLAGYPDMESAATIVQLVKKQLQIAAPASAAGGNWDCNVSLLPTVAPQHQSFQIVEVNGIATTSTASPFYLGGLVAQGGLPGVNLWPITSGTIDASSTVLGSIDPSVYCRGASRIIGMAFEVVNTTAPLYQQGECTVYRQPCVATLDNMTKLFTGPPVSYETESFRYLKAPPSNIAECQLLYGTRSWHAKEGAYCVSRQNNVDNPLTGPSLVSVTYSPNDPLITGVQNRYHETYNSSAAQPSFAPITTEKVAPFDISGAYFTGLSNSTTLTINVRWLIERMPTTEEPDLVVLAQPSPSYDSIALELFSHAMSGLPPGVMLGENPFGEWFDRVLRGIAQYAPTIGTAVGSIPGLAFAAPLGAVIGYGARKLAGPPNLPARPLQGSASTTNQPPNRKPPPVPERKKKQ